MCKLDKLGFVFALVNCRGKGVTQLALSARKTKCLSRINQAFAATEEMINRWGSDVARLREIPYTYSTLTTFVDCCSSCFKQSLASGVFLSHKQILFGIVVRNHPTESRPLMAQDKPRCSSTITSCSCQPVGLWSASNHHHFNEFSTSPISSFLSGH